MPLSTLSLVAWWSRLPRLETILLLVSFAWTVGTKGLVLGQAIERLGPTGWAVALLPDVLFFSMLGLVFSLAALVIPGAWTGRALLIIAVAVLLWSGANAAWLIATGVQLQPGVLGALVQEPAPFWPILRTHASHRRMVTGLLMVTLAVGGLGVLWRVIRPAQFHSRREVRLRRIKWPALATVISFVGVLSFQDRKPSGPTAEMLCFSSHWYALLSCISGGDQEEIITPGRQLPFVVKNPDPAPTCWPAELPNIIVLLLESASHQVTSLGNPALDTTPHLRQLALEGTEFVNTRTPVAHTTDAIWSVSLGIRPEMAGDNVETVLMDTPYAGLPTVLRRYGYRSAFFQISKGSFECAPGLMANLGFDWAWFRENLEDPSAHLGYLGGDDLRMLEPALSWACREPNPFFLMMITSASHDPFLVPTWYAPPVQDRQQAYLQSIRFNDYFLSQLREALGQRGIEERTILCVIGDHGESFRFQGQGPRYIPYEEIIRVPWVLYWPGHVPASKKITWPCSQLDVAPTLAALIGLDSTSIDFEGRDAFQPGPMDRKIYFASWYTRSPRGYVVGDRKYVYWPYNERL
jgi:glucan phosphoethanolaminetransferase (alkaline phosphatase superfamily)